MKPVAGNTTTTRAVRTKFLTQKFSTYEDLDRSRKLMGLNISQSNRSRTRIRYRDKSGPKKGHLVTFRYNKSSGAYQRATQVCGAHITLTLTLTLTTGARAHREKPQVRIKGRPLCPRSLLRPLALLQLARLVVAQPISPLAGLIVRGRREAARELASLRP